MRAFFSGWLERMRAFHLGSRAHGRAWTRALLLACVASACSASENANHSIRCDSNTLCPSQMVCYREFCIPDDALPRFDLDATVVAVDPSASDAGSVSVPPVTPVNGTDASLTDGAFGPGVDQDAGTAPVPEPITDGATTPPVAPPAQGPGTPPASAPDAGSAASDAGRVNSSALLICVPSCASRSNGCWFCLNGVLATNPGICARASRADPVSSGLCDFLCTNADCRGEP